MQRLFPALALPALWLVAGGCSSVENAPQKPATGQVLSTNPVPIEIENEHVVVPAALNGREVRLVLDTGASWVLVKPAVAAAAGIQPGRKLRFDAFGSGRAESRLGSADTVGVGPARAENVPVTIVSSAPPFSLPLEGDGLLGLTFLARFQFRLDYEQKLLSFAPAGASNFLARGSSIPLQIGPAWIVHAEVDGIPARLIVDTGASQALILKSWFVEQHQLRTRHPKRLPMVTGVGLLGPMRHEIVRLPALRLGDYTVTNLWAEFETATDNGPGGIAGFIGAPILRRFHLTFDPDGRRLWLEPNASFTAPSRPPASVRSGFIYLPQGTNWIVEDVVADSPAAEAGVRRGDRLLEINGVSVHSLKFEEIKRAFQAEPGTRVGLRLQLRRWKRSDASV